MLGLLLWEVFEGIVLGLASNVYLLLDQEQWQEKFGAGQATPISEDGAPFTKTKYISRLIGAAALPIAIILGLIGLLHQLLI